MMMAGLDGIKNKIHPGDAVRQGPVRPRAGRTEKAFRPSAISLEMALDALDSDRDFLKAGGVFTDDLIDAYIASEAQGCAVPRA